MFLKNRFSYKGERPFPTFRRSCGALLLTLLFLCLQNPLLAENKLSKTKVNALMESRKQIGFLENKGQMLGSNLRPVPFVLYKAEIPGLNIWVTTTGLTYQFFTIDKTFLMDKDGNPVLDDSGNKTKQKTARWHRVDMVLKGGVIKKENITPEGEINTGSKNYYLGHCANGIFGVKTFAKVKIKEVYPGVDWVIYTTKDGKLKHDFIVHPGADPNSIKLVYEGSGSISITNGKVQFSNEIGKVIEGNLLCYQEDASNKVNAAYNVLENKRLLNLGAGIIKSDARKKVGVRNPSSFSLEVDLNLDPYNRNKDLIIDPELAWGTLYGGNADDGIMDIATDSQNNLFATGYAYSVNFPIQDAGTYTDASPVLGDIFFLKFDPDGQLLWATYYGGDDEEIANSMVIGKNDDLWITGRTTSSNFPVSAGAFQTTFNASSIISGDVVILRFDNNGNRQMATYYGGFNDDVGYNITVDLFDNVWIVGSTRSNDFPITPGAFQNTNAGLQDIFLLKLDENGNQLMATYYGGTSGEEGRGISADGNGNIWITGYCSSNGLATPDAFQVNKNSASDVIVAKFDNNTGTPIYATYYGGSSSDHSHSILSDINGNVWISGTTGSSDFPLTSNAIQNTFGGGGSDVFILKLNNSGSPLWATYYGGNEAETIGCYNNLLINACGEVFVGFDTKSNNIPTKQGNSCHYFDGTHGDINSQGSPDFDCFISQFDTTGNLKWATYVGGTGSDNRTSLTVDINDNLIMAGEFKKYLQSSDLPMLDPANGAYFEATPAGDDECYILKFVPSNDFSSSQTDPSSCEVCDGSATVSVNCGTPSYNYEWSNGYQEMNTSDTSSTVDGLCPGDYSVVVTTSCNPEKDTLYFSMTNDCPVPETDLGVFIPTSFTPNSDGLNDFFYPMGQGIANKDYAFKVFNRWGQIIFESTTPFDGWNGSKNNKILPQGIYIWQLEFEDVNGNVRKSVGRVALIP